MLRHVEGNLDSERAGILRSIDNGNDTCADGDQRQGDLIQRTVWVAWRNRQREKKEVKVKCLTEALLFRSGSQTDACISSSFIRGDGFLLLAHNPGRNTIIHFSTMLCRNHSLLLNLRQSLKMHFIFTPDL